jgi:hypothetical protein
LLIDRPAGHISGHISAGDLVGTEERHNMLGH